MTEPNIQVLNEFENSSEAKELLQDVYNEIKEVLEKYDCVINNLCEFCGSYPKKDETGSIYLKLRTDEDPNVFLSFEEILESFLQENEPCGSLTEYYEKNIMNEFRGMSHERKYIDFARGDTLREKVDFRKKERQFKNECDKGIFDIEYIKELSSVGVKYAFETGNVELLKMCLPHLKNGFPVVGQWVLRVIFKNRHKDMINFVCSSVFKEVIMKHHPMFFEWNSAFYGAIECKDKELIDLAIKEHGEWLEKHEKLSCMLNFSRILWSEGLRLASPDYYDCSKCDEISEIAEYLLEQAEKHGEKIRECEMCRYDGSVCATNHGLSKKNKQMIGFWKHDLKYWEETCMFEMPIENSNTRDKKDVKEWCLKLTELQKKLKENVVEGKDIIQYFGSSVCRLCKKGNGSEEYYSGEFVWPSGYLHYVIEHNIHIPDNFWNFIDNISISSQ